MRTKGKIITACFVVAILVVGISLKVYSDHKTILSQSATRVSETFRHTKEGHLRAAESLLFQVETDLSTLDRWYVLTSIKAQAASIREDASAARNKLNVRADTVTTYLQHIAQRMRDTELEQIRADIQVTESKYPKGEPTLATLGKLVDRLAVQDFAGTEEPLLALPQNLLDTEDVKKHISALGATCLALRDKYAQAVRSTLQAVKNHASKGEFVEAKKAIKLTQSSFSKAEPTLEAVSGFVDRLAVQDFAGAEKALQKISQDHSGLSYLHEISSALRSAVEIERKANHAKHSAIAEQVKELAKSGTQWAFNPVLRGRAMVWDFTTNDIEKAYELLPDDLRASSRDGVITIFCIRERSNVQVGRYSISGQPAYQEHMEIAVIYWPAKEFAGVARITGGHPAPVRPVSYFPGYGSSVSIKEWIERLPKQ